MKHNKYTAWIEKEGKAKKRLCSYTLYAFTITQARILAKADAIKMGFNYKLVKIIKDD